MVTTTTIAQESTKLFAIAEQRIILENISWATFERILGEVGDRRCSRFFYNQGKLEIMSPLYLHEGSNRFIDDLVRAYADEMDIDLCKAGSLLMKLPELGIGAEPDSSYYIQNETLIRGKSEIIMGQDPPPDLVLEVDITNPSDRRLKIYAQLGIPEVWRYDGNSIDFLLLVRDQYQPASQSRVFPCLSSSIILECLQKRLQIGERQALKQFRAWLQTTVK